MYAIEPKGVLAYFLGDWKVRRDISGFGRVAGRATFQVGDENDQCLDFQESMVLPALQSKGQDQKPNAFRAYQYHMTSVGFDIFFADGPTKGNVFLSFAFTQASMLMSDHLCIKDHYDATFEFISADQFELSFSVVGPKKDYSIRTQFTRL